MINCWSFWEFSVFYCVNFKNVEESLQKLKWYYFIKLVKYKLSIIKLYIPTYFLSFTIHNWKVQKINVENKWRVFSQKDRWVPFFNQVRQVSKTWDEFFFCTCKLGENWTYNILAEDCSDYLKYNCWLLKPACFLQYMIEKAFQLPFSILVGSKIY